MFKRKRLDDLEFPSLIDILDIEYSIIVKFFKKRSSSVVVKGKSLEFRMSSYLTYSQCEKHFNSLLKSIVKKLSSQKLVHNLTFSEIFERGWFNFAGTKFAFEISKFRGVKLVGDIIYYNMHTSLENLEKHVSRLLLERYSMRIEEYVREINSETYGYDFSHISVKILNSKWGHCTSRGEIMINLKLLNTSTDILYYVVIHELAHIKYKNHSQAFWSHVSLYCPNYLELRKLLKHSPPDLFNESKF